MKTLALAFACTLLASAAHAQATSPASALAPTTATAARAMPDSDAKRDKALEAHVTALHKKLQVTPAEEAKWEHVAQAMRDSANETDRIIDKREAIVGAASAMDNLTSYAEVAQAHADGVKRLASAFGPLYADMSVDQKKVADSVFRHGGKTGKPSGK